MGLGRWGVLAARAWGLSLCVLKSSWIGLDSSVVGFSVRFLSEHGGESTQDAGPASQGMINVISLKFFKDCS